MIRYLIALLARPDAAGRAFEIGGPEVMPYSQTLHRVAAIKRWSLPILPAPLLTPWLSSLWLKLVTNVNPAAGRTLIDSMSNEVVARDPAIKESSGAICAGFPCARLAAGEPGELLH